MPPPLCGTDWLPYAQSLREAARADPRRPTTARGRPRDPFADHAATVYQRDGPQHPRVPRTMLSLTDTPSAAQYGLQTARLSRAGDDGADRTFIAPDDAGLTAGVAAMEPGAVAAVLEPDPKAERRTPTR